VAALLGMGLMQGCGGSTASSANAVAQVSNQSAGSGTVTSHNSAMPVVKGSYGPGVQFDALNNAQIAEADVDYRFRAAVSDAVQTFTWYDAFGKNRDRFGCDGYGCGTGGAAEICIYPDDNTPDHLWTGSPLSCVTDSDLRNGTSLRSERFPDPPVLVAGTLYHLHWHNSDPNPAQNYVSVDDMFVWNATTPRQPAIPDTDLAVLIGNRSLGIETRAILTDSPIFQLNYANGAVQGQGYIESWIDSPADISGAVQVREQFTVGDAGRVVTSVSVRVNRASGNGPLTVTLATSSGAIIEQGTISASTFPEGALMDDASNTSTWGAYTFATPHALILGQSYQLTLSAPAGTRYQAYGIRKGSLYSFKAPSFFGDGYGQFSADNGLNWTGFTQPGGTSNRADADIQFYFATQ